MEEFNTVNDEIKRVLLECGIYPNRKGFSYLCAAIRILLNEPCGVCALYDKVGKLFNVKRANVERCIRVCLGEVTNSGSIMKLNDIFGMRLIGENSYLSNGDFIGIVAVYLELSHTKR